MLQPQGVGLSIKSTVFNIKLLKWVLSSQSGREHSNTEDTVQYLINLVLKNYKDDSKKYYV